MHSGTARFAGGDAVGVPHVLLGRTGVDSVRPVLAQSIIVKLRLQQAELRCATQLDGADKLR